MFWAVIIVPSCNSIVILPPGLKLTGPTLVKIASDPDDAGLIPSPPLKPKSKNPCPVPTPVLSSVIEYCI